MLTAVSHVECHRLSTGNASRSIFKAARNVARRRDGGIPVNAISPKDQSAVAAPPTPSGLCGQLCHRRSRTH
jgi:hypothetical protein